MSSGWIKLHRELFEKSIWLESTPQQKTILITLMGMANFKANKWEFKGEQYELQPGQFITSVKSIVAKCGPGITTQNVRTALKRFEKLGFLTSEPTNKNTLITLVNWGFYQGCEDEVTNNLTNDSQTVNNYRRSKEIKNINSADESTPAAASNEPIKATKAEQIPYKQIIDYLNEKANKSFKHTAVANQKLIKARWNEGYTFDDFKHVIDTKTIEWLNNQDMKRYLQPSTLFGNKFDKYLNEQPRKQSESKPYIVTKAEKPDWMK